MSDDSTQGWMPPGQQPVPRPEPIQASEPRLPPPGAPAGTPSGPPVVGGPPTGAPTIQMPTMAGGTPPPPPPFTAPASGDEAGHSGGRSKKVLVGGVIGVLAIGAAGVFAVTQMSGDNDGGAASPEELGNAVMESIDQEDFLGVIDLLLPGERETFGEPLKEMVDELRRLEVVSDGASLEGIDGFDVELADRSVDVSTTNVDDIANITMTADATVTVNGDELPVGQLLTDNFGDVFDEIAGAEQTESGLAFSLPITAVEQDGRWYISGMYTIAENARQSAGFDEIPAEGIAPKGGDSPEGAVDVLLSGVEQLDLSAIIGAINPDEAEALQRYAPLFLGEAQAALDEIPLTWQVTDTEYDVSGSGSTRSVVVKKVHIEGEIRDPSGDSSETVPFSLEYADGCYKAEAQGDSIDTCADGTTGDLTDVEDLLAEFGADEAFDESRAVFDDILSDYEQPGITVKQVDGEWYVSPIATGFDQLFAVTHALDRDELERAAEAIGNAVGSIGEVYSSEFDDLYGGSGVNVDGTPPAATVPGDTIPGDTVPGDTGSVDTGSGDSGGAGPGDAEEAYSTCLQSATAEEARDCITAGIDSGVIPDYYLPVELQFVECGLGDVFLDVTPEDEMTDEEYTALLTKANECFRELIDAGSVEEYLVPPEYLRPECAEGRNPWSFETDDDGLFDRWLDCIYA